MLGAHSVQHLCSASLWHFPPTWAEVSRLSGWDADLELRRGGEGTGRDGRGREGRGGEGRGGEGRGGEGRGGEGTGGDGRGGDGTGREGRGGEGTGREGRGGDGRGRDGRGGEGRGGEGRGGEAYLGSWVDHSDTWDVSSWGDLTDPRQLAHAHPSKIWVDGDSFSTSTASGWSIIASVENG